MSKVVTIVGGHGKIALRLAHLLKDKAKVTSIIRSQDQAADITAASATPLVLSLESDPVERFTSAFEGSDVVVFSAGAGGKSGPERTKAVDYEGALKVYDAIEATKGEKPRLLLVSAIDVRNPDIIPDYYNEEDKKISEWSQTHLANYYKWKYQADKDLIGRTAFKWTILRPTGLLDTPGTGKASIGRSHLVPTITRDDVAQTLALLVDRPDAHGLALDIVSGETPLEEALDEAIKTRATAWVG